jgi:uncharacterized membrane protein/glutaredoxin
MSRVILYSKTECSLCGRVRENLLALRSEFNFTLDEIDIEGDADCYERYKDTVPVVVIEGWGGLRLPVETDQEMDHLRQALALARRVERRGARPGQEHGLPRGLVIALDKGIFWLSQHWLFLFNLAVGLYAGLPLLAPFLIAVGLTSPARLIYFVYRFNCHQIPSRSFFVFGYQMAYCQRCTATYTSILIGGLIFAVVRDRLKPLSWKLYLLALVPMAIDGTLQLFGLHESNWWLRTVSGTLFGLASVWLFYPYVEMAMKDVRETLSEKLRRDGREVKGPSYKGGESAGDSARFA